jgi:protein-S-isoprenylcysteine O-methyltransferase Ste14
MTETHYEEQPYNRLLGRIRLIATALFVIALLLVARPDLITVIIGGVIVAMGEAVRFWAAGHLYKTHKLITSGPYRYTRNPLYLGRLLIFTGFCVMTTLPFYSNLVVMVLGWVYFFAFYMRRKERVEPARLKRYHGEAYERYYQAVPALLPTFKPYTDASDGRWMTERMLRNREYLMVIGLTVAFLLLLWRALGPGWSLL